MTTPTTDPHYRSDCHNAAVYVVGTDEGTNHYECVACKEMCDYHSAMSQTTPASGKDEVDKMLDKVLTVQYNLVTTNDLKKSLAYEIEQLIAQQNHQAVQKALDLGEQSPWEVTVGSGVNNINIHLTHPKDVAEYGRAFQAIERLAALAAAQARKDGDE